MNKGEEALYKQVVNHILSTMKTDVDLAISQFFKMASESTLDFSKFMSTMRTNTDLINVRYFMTQFYKRSIKYYEQHPRKN